jgi:hypothetical protein
VSDKPDKTQKPDQTITRRRFLKRAAGVGLIAVVGCGVDALAIEPGWLDVSRPTIVLPRLPAGWDGARIALLSDLHHGRLIDLNHIRAAVTAANASRPDLVILLGDYVTRGEGIMGEFGQVLGELRAPLGVLAVCGNHDHWTSLTGIRAMLADNGIDVLHNEHRILTRDGDALCFAGVDDFTAGVPDLATAVAEAPPESPRILLSHNPDYADWMPDDIRVDLMLCGHTHGGQVRIPLLGAPVLPLLNRRYAAGLIETDRTRLYVSRGIGMVGIPVRLNCRPELPIVTLRRA